MSGKPRTAAGTPYPRFFEALLTLGDGNQQIAEAINVSYRTVQNYKAGILPDVILRWPPALLRALADDLDGSGAGIKTLAELMGELDEIPFMNEKPDDDVVCGQCYWQGKRKEAVGGFDYDNTCPNCGELVSDAMPSVLIAHGVPESIPFDDSSEAGGPDDPMFCMDCGWEGIRANCPTDTCPHCHSSLLI